MISGVKIKKLKVIPDERGRLMEILREDDELFSRFGQVYMTTAYPGVVKGWHYHKKQFDNMAVVKGMMKIVLYDGRKDSVTFGELNEFIAGEHNPILVHIPPWSIMVSSVFLPKRPLWSIHPPKNTTTVSPTNSGSIHIIAISRMIGNERTDE